MAAKRECWTDEELDRIGSEVIASEHAQLQHFRIGFLLVSPPHMKHGRELAGKASKANDRERCLLELDGWVEIAREHWAGEPEEWQHYLLDHELSHLEVRDGELALAGHDFEDFYDVVRRHGLEVAGLSELAADGRSDGSTHT